MSVDPVTKLATTCILIFLLIIGVYLIYAVIKKKPLADPKEPDNFIANLPAWPKSLHRELLFIMGVVFSVTAVWLLIIYLTKWIG